MTYASNIQTLLDQRLKTTGWHIAQTVVLGLLAACLALFGQVCLVRARPIFPFIDQNYQAWQGGYTLVLIVIGVVWVVAMLQKISFFQDCLERLRSQRRLDEQYALRAELAEQARQEKLAAKQAREAAAARPFRSSSSSSSSSSASTSSNTRSNKFDY